MKKFDKYFYYTQAVQSPEEDISFFIQAHKRLCGKEPLSFREDFCGTFALGAAWVQRGRRNKAFVVDHDRRPLDYGRARRLPHLSKEERGRLCVLNKSALSLKLPRADIVSVSNFSYFALKERSAMLAYFKQARKAALGLFILDMFGGPDAFQDMEESRPCGGFTYYWEQSRFNPLDNTARFSIHFKRRGERKRRNVFVYDWRVWTLPEIKDLLREAGFQQTFVYMEDMDSSGEETGRFRKRARAKGLDTYIAYIVSRP